ncbi:cache domain-containing protein [Desulfobacter latus]|uniref:histidine kinase n=1 Tax=Desulfobacter latus TaxID=2292 RepID=A0A850SYY5_9BACT|nr:cache domain-containing protein [Desulfobacter latus]NWH04643.1 cache domain-containing protein [Desulfobacter latus]
MKRSKSIKNMYLIGMISVAFISITISSVVMIIKEYQNFRVEADESRTIYIDEQKALIKNEVEKVIEYIEYMKSLTEERLERNMKNRTNEAIAIASNIYNENRDIKTRTDIEKMIKDALRPVRFNHGRGYYFATDLTGIEQLFADRPELEGKNLIGMTDTQGKFVIQDMIKIAKNKKEGYYRYNWTKPGGKGKDFPKIAYIKYFEPMDWFIGTGEYLDDVESDIKKEILTRISKIRFGKDGYIFVVGFDGVTLMNATQPDIIGKNIWDMTDPNGVKVIQAERRAAETPAGDFIRYVWEKPTTNMLSPKISFIKGVHDWQWMVGAGAYLDEIESQLAQKKELLFDGMIKEFVGILLTLFLIVIFIYPIAKLISNRLKNNFDVFTRFFKVAANQSIKIKSDQLNLVEFEPLVEAANQMIEVREKNKALLVQNEQRYKKAQEMGQVGNWEYDIGNEIFWGSEEAKRIYGFDPESEKFLTDEIEHCIPERERVHQALIDLIENDKPYDLEFEIHPVSGPERRIVKSIAELVGNDAGAPLKVIGVIQDITEQKTAEELIIQSQSQLNEKNQLLSAILQHTHMMAAFLDSEFNFLWVNQAYADACKRLPSFFPGKNHFDLYPHQENQIIFETVVKTGKEYSVAAKPFEFPDQPERGVTYWDWSLIPTKTESGLVDGLVFTLFEVTDRIEAEKQVHDAKERFQKVFNSQLDAIFILGPEKPARIIEMNKAVSTLFGYTKDEILGQPADMLHVNEKYLAEFQDALFHAVKTQGYLKDFEFSMKRKDGRIFPTEHTVLELNDETGQRTGWVSIVRDLTERKKFESHMRQTQKIESIGNLAGGIAHDFNNILFPIVGMSELLLEDLPPESIEREKAQEIYKAGKRGSELVKQILAFSRQSDQKPIPTRIQKVLKEVSKLIRPTIPANIEITWDIQQDCGMVMADPTQLHQIAMNLITNAYHAVDPGNGKIDIRLKEKEFKTHSIEKKQIEPGRYAALSVSDNGCGIDSETLEMIFEPYFTTKAQGKGTGLGLAVVHGIVKEYGGEIFVTSKSDKGSSFEVCIPLMKSEYNLLTDDLQNVAPSGTERILVVDDEVPIAKLEGQMLKRLGYKVTISIGSQEALNSFKKSPDAFDLILTDMSMPNMTGDQLAYEIRKITPGMPIIICTGFSERINKERAEKIGVNGFLMKPIVKSDMAGMVRKVLDETPK